MNKILKLSITGALAVAASTASAWNPTTLSADIELHHAGASASSSTFFDNVRGLCVGDADIFVDAGVVANAGNALDEDNLFEGNYWVVACEMNSSTIPGLSGGGSGAGGNQRVLYYKRDAGGSGVGVFPVAAQSTVAFMGVDVNNCPTVNGADNFHVCLGYSTSAGNTSLHELAAPELGSSDVEPQIFAAPLNNPTGVDFDNDGFADPNPAADVSVLTPEGAGYLGFGVVVNTRAYTGLQFDQFDLASVCNPGNAGYGSIDNMNANANSEACMPSMTKAAVSSLFASGRQANEIGEISDKSTMPANGGDGDATDDVTAASIKPLENLTDDRVQVCRRVQGSGTQAQHNIEYFNYPCEANQDGDFDVTFPAIPSFLDNSVTFNSGSSDLARCLLSYNKGTNEGSKNPNQFGRVRWAIGLQSLTRTDTYSRQFRYVKIDGVAPSINNMHSGKYTQWYGQSFQRAPVALTTGQNQVLDQIVASQNDPATLALFNVTHGFGEGGWVAVPDATNVPTSTLNIAAPIGRFEKVSNGGIPNSCATPRAFGANGVKIELN